MVANLVGRDTPRLITLGKAQKIGDKNTSKNPFPLNLTPACQRVDITLQGTSAHGQAPAFHPLLANPFYMYLEEGATSNAEIPSKGT